MVCVCLEGGGGGGAECELGRFHALFIHGDSDVHFLSVSLCLCNITLSVCHVNTDI